MHYSSRIKECRCFSFIIQFFFIFRFFKHMTSCSDTLMRCLHLHCSVGEFIECSVVHLYLSKDIPTDKYYFVSDRLLPLIYWLFIVLIKLHFLVIKFISRNYENSNFPTHPCTNAYIMEGGQTETTFFIFNFILKFPSGAWMKRELNHVHHWASIDGFESIK